MHNSQRNLGCNLACTNLYTVSSGIGALLLLLLLLPMRRFLGLAQGVPWTAAWRNC